MFSDASWDYPAGTYIRNSPGSFHKLFTKEGCTLFVKLEQFQKGDTESVLLQPKDQQWGQGIGNLKLLSLHSFRV
ncbi:MAG TPA: hypothetical protein EYO59_07165 [Chromatiaceae bacterium]|nr:hypothetical protein [Chromatiaceae bacterium]